MRERTYTCATCNIPFTHDKAGRPPRDCPGCRVTGSYRCEQCGTQEVYVASKAPRSTLCKRCRAVPGQCMECGVTTVRAAPSGPTPSLCSPCKRKRNTHKAAVYRERPGVRERERERQRLDARCLDCHLRIPFRTGERRLQRCGTCAPIHRAAQRTRKDREKKFRQYNLTAEQYDAMLAGQGGGCAFCGTTRAHPTEDHDFYIDHDHACCPGRTRSCGKCVRFLLCSRCNVGLGYFADNPEVLRAAADALELYRLSAPAEGILVRGAVHA